MIIKDSNVTINVSDMERSILFYQSIGFTLKKRWGVHYAQLTSPGMNIGLHPSDKTFLLNNSGNVSLGFTAENFNEVKSHLEELSIATTGRQEEGGEFLHFTDPDGTALYFIKPKW